MDTLGWVALPHKETRGRNNVERDTLTYGPHIDSGAQWFIFILFGGSPLPNKEKVNDAFIRTNMMCQREQLLDSWAVFPNNK